MMNDYEVVNDRLSTIFSRKGFDLEEQQINPYQNRIAAQKKCTHMWANETDAIYLGAHGHHICAICKKVF